MKQEDQPSKEEPIIDHNEFSKKQPTDELEIPGLSDRCHFQNLKTLNHLNNLKKLELHNSPFSNKNTFGSKQDTQKELQLVNSQMDSMMFNLNHSLLCPDDQKYLNFYENEEDQAYDVMSKNIRVV